MNSKYVPSVVLNTLQILTDYCSGEFMRKLTRSKLEKNCVIFIYKVNIERLEDTFKTLLTSKDIFVRVCDQRFS